MGAEPWFYIVPYQESISNALHELRQREFAAGRYNPVIPTLEFPIGPHSPCPGPEHPSIQKAIEASMESGTRSVLDIERLSNEPDYLAVCPLQKDKLLQLYGTTKPTREQVETNLAFFEIIERGQDIYLLLYEDEEPTELIFAGCSFD